MARLMGLIKYWWSAIRRLVKDESSEKSAYFYNKEIG